jgi:hypothetical protein
VWFIMWVSTACMLCAPVREGPFPTDQQCWSTLEATQGKGERRNMRGNCIYRAKSPLPSSPSDFPTDQVRRG